MSADGQKRKLAAIFSADVKDYSRLMQDDETATVETLKAYRGAIEEAVEKHQGRVVDSPGDNLLADFASVVDAVQAAIDVQEELAKRNANLPEHRRMDFRIGINLGDVIEEESRLYGDGVNVAARIEGLADPGGICVSASAYEQVKSKLDVEGKYLGQFDVKNIAEPVRVWAIFTDATTLASVRARRERRQQSRKVGLVAGFVVIVAVVAVGLWSTLFQSTSTPVESGADKPSIAVLAFDNMSGDPEQEYFSNGISENLITDLSKIPDLLVVSRTSSFAYKGKPAKIEQIAGELDVRYVLEGSVQKAGDSIRINAQLIDARTGHHLWAERYDGRMNDVFALQDEITLKIATSLALELTDDERDRLTQQGTNSIEAYEAFLKGSDTANYLRMDPEWLAKSIPWFEKSIELDPNYSNAYAALAETYLRGSVLGIHRKLGISLRLARMRAANYLRTAMEHPTPIAYRETARLYVMQHQHEKALDHAEKAMALDPNDADNNSVMAQALIYSGRPDEAVAFAERMRRIDPACLF